MSYVNSTILSLIGIVFIFSSLYESLPLQVLIVEAVGTCYLNGIVLDSLTKQLLLIGTFNLLEEAEEVGSFLSFN